MTTTTNAINGVLLGPNIKSAFGEFLIAQPTAAIQLQFPYGLNTDYTSTIVVGSGTTPTANSMAGAQTGTTTGSSAMVYSDDAIHYYPGEGATILFTGIYTSGGAATTLQYIGAFSWDLVDGFGFGYSAATFGIFQINNSSTTFIAQTSWNVDKMNGTGPSGMTLDPTKGNVYRIQYQYLGFGDINFYIENANNGQFVLVHQIQYANANTNPSLSNASLQLLIYANNGTSTNNLLVQTAGLAAFVEGQVVPISASYAVRPAAAKTVAIANGETNVLTIRNNGTVGALNNRVRVYPNLFSFSAQTQRYTFNLRLNATLTTPSYTNINAATSVVSFDTAGTYSAGTGQLIFSFQVAASGRGQFDLSPYFIRMNPLNTQNLGILTVTATTTTGTGTVQASLNWQERW